MMTVSPGPFSGCSGAFDNVEKTFLDMISHSQRKCHKKQDNMLILMILIIQMLIRVCLKRIYVGFYLFSTK